MRLLVTGAGGQLGHDVVRRGDGSRRRRRRRSTTPRSTSPTATPCSARSRRGGPTPSCTARRGPPSTPARAIPGGRSRPTPLAVRWVAEACDRVGAHLVHVSTDYVFDGTLDRPYLEWDATGPRSVYGASKLAGEREALALGPRPRSCARRGCAASTARTWSPPCCGWRPSGPGSAGALAFVDDQRGHPTFTADLAPLLRRLALDRRSGVIHATNQGAVSWYEFVGEVLPRPPATTRRWCARSRRPSSTRRARRRARPTACSTTPCCAPPASRCCATSARRSPSSSPACRDVVHAGGAGVVPRRHGAGSRRARSAAAVRRHQPRVVDGGHPDPLRPPRQPLLSGAVASGDRRPGDRPRLGDDRRGPPLPGRARDRHHQPRRPGDAARRRVVGGRAPRRRGAARPVRRRAPAGGRRRRRRDGLPRGVPAPEGRGRHAARAARRRERCGWCPTPAASTPTRRSTPSPRPTARPRQPRASSMSPNLGGILTTSRSGRDPSQQVRKIPPGFR